MHAPPASGSHRENAVLPEIAMSAVTLYTIGYSGFTPETLVTRLKSAGIAVLIDVRRNPFSRKPGFSKARLEKFLQDRGIEYVHAVALGVPESFRAELRDGGDVGDYFAAFRRYLADCDDALAEVEQRTRRQRCCLMCLEKRPTECHRSLVTDELQARSNGMLQIEHLLWSGETTRELDFE